MRLDKLTVKAQEAVQQAQTLQLDTQHKASHEMYMEKRESVTSRGEIREPHPEVHELIRLRSFVTAVRYIFAGLGSTFPEYWHHQVYIEALP